MRRPGGLYKCFILYDDSTLVLDRCRLYGEDMIKDVAPIEPLDGIRSQVYAAFEGLSGQLQKAARFVIDHPEEIAMQSMRSISREADIHPSTFVRLAKKLGFDSYDDLRAQFRSDVRYKLGSFGQKARRLQAQSVSRKGKHLMAELLETEIANLRTTVGANSTDDLDRAVDMLAAARHIFVIGRRSFFPAAYLFHFCYSMFAENAYLGADQSGTQPSALARLTSQDVLFAFSFDPYASEVIEAARFANDRQCPVIAVTDSSVSPLARTATISLIAKNESPLFFQSVMSSLLVVQYLVMGLLVRRGVDGSASLEATEAGLRALGVYWPDVERGGGNT